MRYSPHVDFSKQLCNVVIDLIFVHHPAPMLRMFCHDCNVIWATLVRKLTAVVVAAHTKKSHCRRTGIRSLLVDLAKDISWSPTLRSTISSALLALPRDFFENRSHRLSCALPSWAHCFMFCVTIRHLLSTGVRLAATNFSSNDASSAWGASWIAVALTDASSGGACAAAMWHVGLGWFGMPCILSTCVLGSTVVVLAIDIKLRSVSLLRHFNIMPRLCLPDRLS